MLLDNVTKSTMRMLVVDDHDLVRLGLRTLLTSQARADGQEVNVFEARSLQEAMRRYDEQAGKIDLILLDLHLPDAHGLSGLITFKQQYPHAHVVVLSGVNDPALMREAIARGASAYLTKSGDLMEVVNYVSTHTHSATTAESPASLPESSSAPTRTVRNNSGDSFQLTARQAQILDWILCGRSNRQIAELAHLSEGTVKNHVSTLLLIFGVRSRAQLITQLR